MTERKLTKRELDHPIITPAQMAMARAACCWTMRDLAEKIGCTHNAIALYERQGTNLGPHKIADARKAFEAERVFFGPRDGVCIGSDVFKSERWLAGALWKLLNDAGVYPDSQSLIRAGKEASNA